MGAGWQFWGLRKKSKSRCSRFYSGGGLPQPCTHFFNNKDEPHEWWECRRVRLIPNKARTASKFEGCPWNYDKMDKLTGK